MVSIGILKSAELVRKIAQRIAREKGIREQDA
ncbi:hypothetical protein CDIFMA2_20130 [Clostridioides difficile]|nr:hypothetical protein CDIFMA2_20130 [Clostridioides difficile]